MSWENEQGTQYRNEYQRQHYDRFSLMLPKGKKNEYMALAEKNGMKELERSHYTTFPLEGKYYLICVSKFEMKEEDAEEELEDMFD